MPSNPQTAVSTDLATTITDEPQSEGAGFMARSLQHSKSDPPLKEPLVKTLSDAGVHGAAADQLHRQSEIHDDPGQLGAGASPTGDVHHQHQNLAAAMPPANTNDPSSPNESQRDPTPSLNMRLSGSESLHQASLSGAHHAGEQLHLSGHKLHKATPDSIQKQDHIGEVSQLAIDASSTVSKSEAAPAVHSISDLPRIAGLEHLQTPEARRQQELLHQGWETKVVCENSCELQVKPPLMLSSKRLRIYVTCQLIDSHPH